MNQMENPKFDTKGEVLSIGSTKGMAALEGVSPFYIFFVFLVKFYIMSTPMEETSHHVSLKHSNYFAPEPVQRWKMSFLFH